MTFFNRIGGFVWHNIEFFLLWLLNYYFMDVSIGAYVALVALLCFVGARSYKHGIDRGVDIGLDAARDIVAHALRSKG